MRLPILYKDLFLSLRRFDSFVSAFTLLIALDFVIWALWSGEAADRAARQGTRARLGRELFFSFLVIGYIGFCIRAVIAGARSLVTEREKNTLVLLQAAPISKGNFLAQKLIAPFVSELLLFIGVLPVASLVFVIGGLSPREMILQLTSLLVWIGTAMCMGLWVSSRSREEGQAGRKAMIWLLGSWLLLALVGESLATADLDGWVSLRDEFPVRLLGLFLLFLSPGGMTLIAYDSVEVIQRLSWSVGSVQWTLHDPILAPFADWLTNPMWGPFRVWIGGSVPGILLATWVCHLGIQAILLGLAVHRWNRRSALEGAARVTPKGSRIEFETGAGAFLQLERLLLFRRSKGMSWRMAAVLLGLVGTALAFGTITLFFLIFLIPLGIFMLGIAPNSYRRERNSNTSVFLLSSPMFPRMILLGKWLAYMRACYFYWAIGIFFMVLFSPRSRFSEEITFFTLGMGVAIPLLTLEGLMIGLRVPQKVHLARFLYPLVLGGGLFLLVALGDYLLPALFPRFSYRSLAVAPRFISNHPVAFNYLFPSTLVAMAMLQTLSGWGAPRDETEAEKTFRRRAVMALLAYLILDGLSLVLFPTDFGGEKSVRTSVRFFLSGLWLNWLIWLWLARRDVVWWRDRLFPSGG